MHGDSRQPLDRRRPREGNPRLRREEPAALRLQRPARAARRAASISTRIRLRDTQNVLAIAEQSDGTFWSDRVNVIVTIGACLEDVL
jgi:sulfur-oxidizing protein SoxY